MIIQLTFNELQKIIQQRTNKDLTLGFVNDNTCSVATTMPMPIINRPISVTLNLTVERIEGTDLYLSIGGMPGIEMVLGPAMTILQSNVGGVANGIPEGFVEKISGNQLVLHLDKIERLQQILAKLTLESVVFTPDSLAATLAFV
ncbi:MAG: hypothetical protein MJZ08_04270 [Bacteroidaceae bacterium]|nr:hypothetical protein [Bacteroidaceae bacterium]